MFKQRLRPTKLTRGAPCWGPICALMVLLQFCSPAQAKHDEFLYGQFPDIKPSAADLPGETSLAHSAPVQEQRQAIFALYVAPLLLRYAEGGPAGEIKRRAQDALLILPEQKKEKKTHNHIARERDRIDSLEFLRWRLEYIAGEKKKVTAEVADFLTRRNKAAAKEGTILCVDLISMSEEFTRQGRYLDASNLFALSHYLTVGIASELATKDQSGAVRQYERHVAEAYAMAKLDRREEATEHFSQAINYLRPMPVGQRPQTDQLRKALLRVVDVDLIKYENDMIEHKKLGPLEQANQPLAALSDDQRRQLKLDIDRLIDIAYLAKIDRRLGEAAFLFRRAFLLIDFYLKDEENRFSALYYDLGETLLWDGKYDDSVYYFDYCVRIRAAENPLSLTTLDASSLLARARLLQGQSKISQDIFFNNLLRVAKRAKLKVSESSDRSALIDALLTYLPSAGADERRQIDDGLQGAIDSSIPLKQYDVAIECGEALLKLRSQATPVNDAMMMSVIWGLAYACDSCGELDKGLEFYSRLIKNYAVSSESSLPYWYHGRGLDYDMLGKHESAATDFKKAIVLYEKKLAVEEDEEARDHLTWTIEDLRFNLKTAGKYPASRADYADLPDTCRWRLESFPLKICIEADKERGFGGELKEMVLEAVAIWRDCEGSPIKVEYVDTLAQADIFIERVTVYDDIPYGSAGRTSAIFESKAEVPTKVMTKVHVRIYCPSHDGSDWEGQDVKMSKFAKVQFKTLLVHELGHAFGLTHSPAGQDIMYWKTCADRLSTRDINTLNRIYKSGSGRKTGRS